MGETEKNLRRIFDAAEAGGAILLFDELNAAFVAVDAGKPVMMKHILAAAKSEYVKLEQALTDTEVKAWV
ncbi:MAG TPA: hypothetical protein V6D30_17925 [Leptolyngbyaceae cyanobacterium]